MISIMDRFSEGTRFVFILGFFYFIQGLPYGLQMYYIPLVLRKNDVTLAKITFMRLTTVPWFLKFLWGPIFDYYNKPVNTWILTCLIGSLFMFLLLSLSSPTSVPVLVVGFVLLNLFCSVMDIAIDSLAIQNLNPEDLGLGNIGQAVGYKIGMLFSGGLLLYLYNILDWKSVFGILSIYYVAIIIIFWYKYFRKETHSHKIKSTKSNREEGKVCFSDILQNLTSVVSCKQNMILVAFLLVYKLGEQGYMSMIPLYLTDSKFSMVHITRITGFNIIVSSIIGSTFSGLLISKLRLNSLSTLKVTLIIRTILLFGNVTLIQLMMLESFLFIILQWLTSAISGMITTATFTVMMETSQLQHESTQASFYTLLATVEVLGKTVMTSLSGMLVQSIGYKYFFMVCAVINIIPVILIWKLLESELSKLYHLLKIKNVSCRL